MKAYKYTSRELAALANIQKDLFIYCRNSKDYNIKISSLYNLVLAFELALKAYLVFLDKKYSSDHMLRNLKHNRIKIYEKIVQYEDNPLKSYLNSIFNKDNYLEFDPNNLRYPKIGTLVRYETFNDIVKFIEKVKIIC